MAGGPFARLIPCSSCLQEGRIAPATRTRDGSETDSYECASGHRLGVEWRQLPTEELWPSEEIARAAYFRYLSRGGAHGGDGDDWLAAEQEVLRSKRWGGPEDLRPQGAPAPPGAPPPAGKQRE